MRSFLPKLPLVRTSQREIKVPSMDDAPVGNRGLGEIRRDPEDVRVRCPSVALT
jgi:hypothetical protein